MPNKQYTKEDMLLSKVRGLALAAGQVQGTSGTWENEALVLRKIIGSILKATEGYKLDN